MKTKKPRFAAKILALVLSMLMLLGAMPVAFAAVLPDAPITEWPTIEGEPTLIFGQNFSNLKLVGGKADVPGHFDWGDPDFSPKKVGDMRAPAYFYPDETDKYEVVRNRYPITIVKSNEAKIEGSLSASLLLGQKLSEAVIEQSPDFKLVSYDTSYTPIITWENPDKIMDKSGTFSEKVVISGEGITEEMMNTVEYTVTVNVIGEEEVVELKEAPTASNIKVGQTLADSELSGGLVTKGENPVAGKFVWKDSSIAPKVGTAKYTAVFTPDDPTACDPIETQVSVTTGKGAPEIKSWPEVKGQYRKGMGVHSCVTLTGGEANIPGKFGISLDYYYKAIPESITEPMDIEIYFIPDDKANYEDVYKTVTVSFEPANPDCEVNFDRLSETEIRVNSFIKNQENWDIKTGKLYFVLDGEKIELDRYSKSFVYDATTIAPGTHTVQTIYEQGESDYYVSDMSDVQEFNIKAIYAVNVSDSAGDKVLGSYLPGKTVTVTAAPHEKSYYDFTGWTAEGVELTEEELAQQKISFTMPENEVKLTANYKFNFKNFVKYVFEQIGVKLMALVMQGIEWIKGLLP